MIGFRNAKTDKLTSQCMVFGLPLFPVRAQAHMCFHALQSRPAAATQLSNLCLGEAIRLAGGITIAERTI